MNLTNDNSVGCRQVAACRGLESMAELIAGHFPSFTRSPLFNELEMPGPCHQKDKHLTDQELDFLVAILGLLVNLVEKDGINRYQTLYSFGFTTLCCEHRVCTVSIDIKILRRRKHSHWLSSMQIGETLDFIILFMI